MTSIGAFIAGCQGASLNTEERAFFARTNPFGLILFKRNCESPEQLKQLTDDFRAAVGRRNAPVLIDQEGGRVQRLGPPSWRRPLPLGTPEVAAIPVGPGDGAVSDLAPVGVRVAEADVTVSGLRVLRDVYYIPAVNVERNGRVVEDKALEFALDADEFFMLGDNSAASKDSRLWLTGHHVDRRLLIGKAMLVFWPHAIPASWSIPVRLGSWELRLPCWPNFGRMRFVR